MCFVPNSSTSSFCIFGMEIEDKKAIKEKFSIDDMFDIEKIIREKDLQIDLILGRDNFYIGRSWKEIGHEQTGRQFKTEIEEDVKNLLGQDAQACSTHEDAWQDG